jgi:CRP-like cAMP-binding protein
VKLCFSRPSRLGFPCASELSERLVELPRRKAQSASERSYASMEDGQQPREDEQIFLADSLDEALAWCEDDLLRAAGTALKLGSSGNLLDEFADRPRYLRQLYALLPEGSSADTVDKLLAYFRRRLLRKDEVVWRQGEPSDSAVILVSGRLLSALEEEAGTTEPVEVGHLVGEYGLINAHPRFGTLVALEPSEVLELTREQYELMAAEEPATALVLSKICMVSFLTRHSHRESRRQGYLHHRVMHVSNRIWFESSCLARLSDRVFAGRAAVSPCDESGKERARVYCNGVHTRKQRNKSG